MSDINWRRGALVVLMVAWPLAGRGADTNVPALELVPPSVLAWDADLKQMAVLSGTSNANFIFWVTNVCDTNVLILSVTSSCGCTVAKLPSQPWLLAPGANGPVHVTLDLQGRYGTLFKGLHVTTSAGVKALVMRADVPLPAGGIAPLPGAVPLPPAATNSPPAQPGAVPPRPQERRPPMAPRKW